MNTSMQFTEYLTSLATNASILPREDCRVCGSQLFRGYAQFLEIKCRSCKTLNLFDGEVVKTYNVTPY